ncbi:MAG TPA: hypothetical protein ENK43_03975 [Planctomycetes bacterium]|nr:hypothetical protein [Planctomycetota bacterium]
MHRFNASFVVLALVAGLTVSCGSSSPQANSSMQGGASPQAVVDGIKKAAAENDIGGVVSCFVPEDRPLMSFGMLMVGDMVVGMMELSQEEEAGQFRTQLSAILKRHGLPDLQDQEEMSKLVNNSMAPEDSSALARKLVGDIDHAAFCKDMQGFLDSIPNGDGSTHEFTLDVDEKKLRLSHLVVDGTRARGKLGDQDVEFVKIDGGWFLHMDPEMLR